MCSWSYLLLKTTVDYVMKKHINNNCYVLIRQLRIFNDIFFQSNMQINRLVTRNYLLVTT
jgi:hypothetical protein